ncbi:ABC transporter permease [Roseivirga sp. E12]|uniref:ABC transporter permease n=1 Tax=Roseivirga sp. E12 TaxID=2819237 RepID=UPI001ABC20C6|nr:ABC transporter permease [Roseivirga sp. E12]MBO3698239.1 ABC transporter permease [Roseivirga sp. E12]
MKNFDLQQHIRQWANQLRTEQGFEPGDIEELEANLWDRIDALMEEGQDAKSAFEKATEKTLSSTRELANEFYKAKAVNPNVKPPWERSTSFITKLPAHFKVAIRHMKKRKSYVIMNILGLAMSISFSLLIWMYVETESGYDQHYENAGRIYRVIFDVKHDGIHVPQADIGQPVGPTMKSDFPEVIEKTRLRRIGATNTFAKGDIVIESTDFFVTDPDFFKVFSAEVLFGDKETALTAPNTVVLTESLAMQLFGRTDVVGETLIYSGVRPPMDMKVKAVIKDLGKKTHLPMRALISYSTYFDQRELINWLRKSYTYVLLNEQNEVETLRSKLPDFSDKYLAEVLRQRISPTATVKLHLQPLTEIYLADEFLGEPYPHGSRENLEILSTIMIFLLVMACINYVNLSTATAVERASEVGIRKTLGSSRGNLIFKFLSESIFLALIAGMVAMLISIVLLPYFSEITGLEKSVLDLFSGTNLIIVLLLSLTMGLLAGLYPSLYITRFQPLMALKPGGVGVGKRGWLRKGLIVIQYAIAGSLMIWIFVIGQQINFVKERDVGFDKSNLLELTLPEDQAALQSAAAFLSELNELPQVKGVTKANFDLASGYGVGSHLMKSPKGEQVNANLAAISVGYGFVEALGAQFVVGRDFNENRPSEKGVLINQSAMDQYGWSDNPLKAKYLSRDRQGEVTGEWDVIGVVSDFKPGESYDMVSPLIIFLDARTTPGMRVLVNVDLQNPATFAPELGKLWERHFPDNIFEFQVLEDRLNRLYAKEETFQQLLTVLNLITVMITILGVVGLISFTTEVRKKEIAIRKISGARVETIMTLLSKQFLTLLVIAFAIAGPIGYYLSSNWLSNFSIHAKFTMLPVGFTFLICLLFTIMAISYHALRAANANPVKALRYE